ncbi:uncharacterized protein LOC141817864 [Curcuma longa]|uniref:uncharacterized protein LOC141817864 n=1 Tax=Curcuma longa TaxID=136217 RepID=UPI003D9F9E17
MISREATDGDSHQARKAHSRSLETYGIEAGKNGPLIHFGPQDLAGVSTPHDDALIIRATIANYNVARVFIDTGNFVSVLYKDAFDKMQIDRQEMHPMSTALFGFSRHEVQPLGQISLLLSLGEEPLWRTRSIVFAVVDRALCLQRYTGETSPQCLPSSRVHLLSKDQVGRKKARIIQGAVQALHETPSSPIACQKEEVQVVPGRPKRVTQIASDLAPELKQSLTACLIQNNDAFAWSLQEVTGVSPDLMEHRLNVIPGSQPVRQKK